MSLANLVYDACKMLKYLQTNLLLGERLDHLGSKIVDSLHFCGFEGQLADLLTRASSWSVYLHLYYLVIYIVTAGDKTFILQIQGS